jgi:hypothetical protein
VTTVLACGAKFITLAETRMTADLTSFGASIGQGYVIAKRHFFRKSVVSLVSIPGRIVRTSQPNLLAVELSLMVAFHAPRLIQINGSFSRP